MRGRFLVSIALFIAAASPASAHPHVWINGQESVVFSPAGEIVAIRHVWVFDEMYSAFVTEGAGKKGALLTKADLAPLAKSNVEDLAEFDYFTHAKVKGVKLEFLEPTDYSLEERPDKLVELRFTMPLKQPIAPKIFSFQVYDPTYFVAFELDKQNPVSFVNAPKGCSTNIAGAKKLADDESKKLTESFFSGLSPGSDFGVKLASSVVVACP
ncbi:protein of unknown function DUF1007 [Methylocella silvestris BL2]|uniref:ABC transporter substrate-binding protein n=1 Tax=Methylocella silvestris (strain DSM 15510 / CIP 108128 / LMG 27833 / NCIMB 13906 / BL2) TaxID=395965 RepID=B8ELU8_METSB|nr:DUF1007 family protein [Methylocella silvestris]ACK50729.1 protein of unknown function DUF1007 [Methylocella silvestris BL2]